MACGNNTIQIKDGVLVDNDYKFRYDNGVSARMGAKVRPLLMPQNYDNYFVQEHPLERTKRVLEYHENWCPPVKPEKVHFEKPAPRPRYIGLTHDPTVRAPNETVLKHFGTHSPKFYQRPESVPYLASHRAPPDVHARLL